MGVYASGRGTEASLVEVEVTDTLEPNTGAGGVGLQAAGGASLRAESSVVRRSTGIGVYGVEDGTTVELVDTLIEETDPLGDGTLGRGVWIALGATVTATRTVIDSATETGLFLSLEGASARVEDVVVRGTRPRPDGTYGRGVELYVGASLTGAGLVVEANRGTGLTVSDPGTVVDLTRSVVADTAVDANLDGRGVDAQLGASVTLTDSEIRGNHEAGVMAWDSGTVVTLIDSEVTDTLPLPDGSVGRGVEAMNGARVSLVGGALRRNYSVGVFSVLPGSVVSLDGTTIEDTARGRETGIAVGVSTQLGGSVEARDCVIRGTEGLGAYAYGGPLVLERCTLDDNRFAGALVLGTQGSLVVRDTEVSGTLADDTLGGGVGVFASTFYGPTILTVEGSTIGPHPYAALWLEGQGYYQVTGNDLSGSEGVAMGAWTVHGNAVFATGGVTPWDGWDGLLLTGNVLRDAPGVAVLLDGASASVAGNSWPDAGVGLWQQRCEGVSPVTEAELAEIPAWERCPEGSLLVDTTVDFPGLYLPEVDLEE